MVLATPFLSVTYVRMMYREPYCAEVALPFCRLPLELNVGMTIKVWLLSFPTVTCTGEESLGAFVPSPV